MKKQALKDQHGLFQHFQSGVADYNTRESYLAQRGGKSSDPQKLYGLGPEHPESYQPKKEKPGSLSTRYVPGRPGIQAMRVSAGVYQDPHTKEIFDYNEGFVTSDGRVFNGGTVDLQTDLASLATRLDSLGLVKEASFLDSILFKLAEDTLNPCHELAMTILSGLPWAAPHMDSKRSEVEGLVKLLGDLCGEEVCSKINEYVNETKNISNTMEEEMMPKGSEEGFMEDLLDEPGFDQQERSRGILAAALSNASSSKY